MKKPKSLFVPIVIICLVILFPIISYLVTMKGAESYRLFVSDLKKNLGELPNYAQNDLNGNLQTRQDVKGNFILFSKLQNQGADSVISVLKVINKTDQFREEVDNFRLITFYDSLNTEKAKLLNTQLSANDKMRWLIMPTNDSIDKIKLPNDYALAIIDTIGIIRHFYDTRLLTDKQLLIQHLALMPLKKKKDVVKVEQKNY